MVRFLVVRTDDKVNVFSAVVAFNTVSIGDFAHGVGVSKIVIDELKKLLFLKTFLLKGGLNKTLRFLFLNVCFCIVFWIVLNFRLMEDGLV